MSSYLTTSITINLKLHIPNCDWGFMIQEKFRIPDYLNWQRDISSSMRAILVDWLVEVQENFELNHETLYLAVKLVDHYLARVQTSKDKLQLVGATAMFIASKFDVSFVIFTSKFLYREESSHKFP